MFSSFVLLFDFSRFRQLKEQEARRKKQREEERRKAMEAADKGIQITNERVNIETGSDREDSYGDISVGATSVVSGGSSPNSMNGNSVNSEAADDIRASVVKEENRKISDDQKNERSDLHLEKNIDKVIFNIPASELFASPLSWLYIVIAWYVA